MKDVLTPIDGLEMFRWKNTKITVYDMTQSPEWKPIVNDAVSQWAQCSSFTLTYEERDPRSNLPKKGIVITEVEGARTQTILSDKDGFISNPVVQLAPPSAYTNTPLEWWMSRSICHELGHCLGVSHGGLHVDHWNADRTEQNLNCCMGGGNQVVSEDFELIAERY